MRFRFNNYDFFLKKKIPIVIQIFLNDHVLETCTTLDKSFLTSNCAAAHHNYNIPERYRINADNLLRTAIHHKYTTISKLLPTKRRKNSKTIIKTRIRAALR